MPCQNGWPNPYVAGIPWNPPPDWCAVGQGASDGNGNVLIPSQFSQRLGELSGDAALAKHYEELNELTVPDAGVVMAAGIAYLKSVLDALDETTLAILIIG